MNIYVIIGKGYTKEKAVREIQEECYQHSFLFGQDIEKAKRNKSYQMLVSDEIWCFGDCKGMKDYNHALDNGYDIWQMG